MIKNKYYYSVCVFSKQAEARVAGCHIIKAYSKINALKIREKYGISNPRFAKGNLRITCKKIDLNFFISGVYLNKKLIERRKRKIGGNIWYEDEKGNLQTEK